MATSSNAIHISDDFTEISPAMLSVPARYLTDVKSVMLTKGFIQDRYV